MTDLVVSDTRNAPAAAQPNLFALAPRAMVARATEIADVLVDVVEKQRLFSLIQGKKYLKVEAWATLGTLLGVMPKERNVIEHANGDFEAFVDLVSQSTGHVIGGGSALCSGDETRWSKAERYARRSMAITRATGKAFRLSFAWITALAGYESTPAEEMPHDEPRREERPREAQRQSEPAEPEQEYYDPQNRSHQDRLIAVLKSKKVNEDDYDKIGAKLKGEPMNMASIQKAIADIELPF
jgi:hypothetical protein